MKKWSFAAGAIMLALLLGTLVLLGCYFFTDLSAAFFGESTGVTTTVATIQTTQTETSEETTLPEETTVAEETTIPEEITVPEETTIPVVTTKPTEPPPTTKPTSPPPTTKPTEPATEPTEVTVTANRAFVYDTSAGKYLYTKGNTTAKIAPASITKLFTAYVALQHLDSATVITAGDELDKLLSGSSTAGIEKGDKLTVETCVKGMLLPSGNDAAYVLAAAAGRAVRQNPSLGADEAVDAFMEEVNAQAKALGMTGTHFVNPDGIHHTNHYTTLDDLVTIAKLSMKNTLICQYAAKQKVSVKFEKGELSTDSWTNSNKLLDPNSKYYSPDAVGLKTGTTTYAGHCLLAAFHKGDRLVFVCVIGSSEDSNRYKDTLALYKAYA